MDDQQTGDGRMAQSESAMTWREQLAAVLTKHRSHVMHSDGPLEVWAIKDSRRLLDDLVAIEPIRMVDREALKKEVKSFYDRTDVYRVRPDGELTNVEVCELFTAWVNQWSQGVTVSREQLRQALITTPTQALHPSLGQAQHGATSMKLGDLDRVNRLREYRTSLNKLTTLKKGDYVNGWYLSDSFWPHFSRAVEAAIAELHEELRTLGVDPE